MAVPPLRALVAAGHDIALCVTRPDRRRGRGGAVTPSPVKEAALELGLPVSHSMEDVAGVGVELAVVVAYGRIIPATLLAQVPMVNLHFSLLPRWRGAAPVERAILAGDRETGVCLMKLEEGLDTGPVYARRVVPIGSDADLAALRAELVELGSALLVESLAGGLAGLPVPEPQEGEPTIASKVDARGPASSLGGRCDRAPPGRAARSGLDDIPRSTAGDLGGGGVRIGSRSARGPRPSGDIGGHVGDHGTGHPCAATGATRESRAHGGGGLGPGCASFGR